MNRGMSAAMQAELDKLQQRTGHLYGVYFDDETVYGTDLYVPAVWGGQTYLALGHYVGFDGVEESSELQVTKARVSLSGVDQAWISRVLNKEYVNRRLVIYRINVDAAWAVIVDPVAVIDGLMDDAVVQENPDSGKSIVVVTVSNHLVDFDRRPGRHTNDEEQRLYSANDGLFKYVDQVNRQLRWGAT